MDKPEMHIQECHNLSVGLGDTLELVLFLRGQLIKRRLQIERMAYLDSIRVRRPLGGVDQFIRQALCNRLDVAEGRFTSLKKS